ncbi:MAG: riboflavin biosynthesis protein RibF [Isosphaeraceae bacterium]
MITIEDFGPVPPGARGAFLAVGNFDGVHRGHAHLIGRLRALADAAGAPAIALTFDPSPAAVLRPEAEPARLTWIERRIELLRQAGATDVGVFRTGRWLLGLTAREFFDRSVIGQFGARGMVEGPTFGFGRDRGGDAHVLGDWCAGAGLAFEIASPTDLGGTIVSSGRIRKALAAGDVADAAEMLGRPHRLRGRVVKGEGRGRQLGFPTANLGGIDVLIPDDGVYAARARVDGEGPWMASAVHIGPNATFGAVDRTVEAFLIDRDIDLYGRPIELDLIDRLRGSRKFDGVGALIEQMHRDVDRARRVAEAGAAGLDAAARPG